MNRFDGKVALISGAALYRHLDVTSEEDWNAAVAATQEGLCGSAIVNLAPRSRAA